jgi:hypothetical protein
MAEDPKKPDLRLVAQSAPEDIFDEIEALRKASPLKVSRRAIPINIAVRKPPDNGYFQCHPDANMRLDASLLIDKEDSVNYFVAPNMRDHPLIAPRLRPVTLAATYTWPAGNVLLWPVPFADERGRVAVWKSARRAFELASGLAIGLDPPEPRWVQITWNQETRDYDVAIAEGININPIWPKDVSFRDMLRLGFADKTIDSVEHPYVRQLRGLSD